MTRQRHMPSPILLCDDPEEATRLAQYRKPLERAVMAFLPEHTRQSDAAEHWLTDLADQAPFTRYWSNERLRRLLAAARHYQARSREQVIMYLQQAHNLDQQGR